MILRHTGTGNNRPEGKMRKRCLRSVKSWNHGRRLTETNFGETNYSQNHNKAKRKRRRDKHTNCFPSPVLWCFSLADSNGKTVDKGSQMTALGTEQGR